MHISIIIPVLDEEKYIDQCLNQFTRFKEQDFEIIVCDGGSTDTTVERIRQRSYVKLFYGKTGRGSQMNEGARHAHGDVLLFLHADSFLPTEGIHAIKEKMLDNGIIGGFFINEMYGYEDKAFLFKLFARVLTMRSRIVRKPYGDMGMFIKRTVFEDMGGYREIPFFEDYEFSRRLVKRGKLVRIPHTLKTSIRRFRPGIIRTVMLMQTLKVFFKLGVPAEKLVKWYKNIR